MPAGALPLSDLPVGTDAIVSAIALDPREAEWLRAVGIFEGTRVAVLRRAALGGPLHVRTSAGAEFAVDRALARAVSVEVAA